MNTEINTSEAERRVISFDDEYEGNNKAMMQVFQAVTTKEDYLTNMAKLILAVEIQDYREIRQFCAD